MGVIFCKLQLKAVLQRDDSIVHALMLAVRGKIPVAHELEAVTGLGVLQALLELRTLQHLDAVGVQVILEIRVVGDAVHVGLGEQLIIQLDLGVQAVGAADPVDRAAHLAAIGGVAVAGLEVGLGVDGHDLTVLVLVHAGAAHQIRAHQADLATQGQALEFRRRHLKEVAVLDPQLLREGDLAGRRVVGVAVRVVGQVKILALVGGIVVDDQLDRLQHGHAALGVQLQLGAQHGLQLAHIHEVVSLGDAGLFHEGEDARRRVAAAAQAGQGRHTGVVPAVHDVLLDQLAQVTLAHDGVRHVQAGKLALLREFFAEQVRDDPLIQRAVVLKLKAAQAEGDALNGVLNGVRKVVHRVDAPLVALAVMLDMLDAVDGRVAHVHVRAGQVDLGAQRFFAVGKLTRAHTAEQVEVLLRRAVTVGARAAGLAGVVAAVLLHFLAGQVIHVGLALLDELLGVLIAALKIVAAVENAAVRLGTQPFQILQDALHVLVTLAGGVRVVKAQVEQAAVVLGNRVVDEDRLGGADMQVAVRLRRETGMYDIDLALGEVGIDNIRQEVGKFFVCHDYTPKLVSVTLL